MKYYLVDYENVNTHGLDGINKLAEEDIVCIFYSDAADTLTFGLHRRINESKATILFQKVDVGRKNALDFQLASYLGYIIHENINKTITYCIVTKDQGFSSLVLYWTRKNIDVSIVLDVSGKNEKNEKNKLKKEVQKLISDEEVIEIVVQFIQKYKTKQGINNALVKHLKDGKKAGEIYKTIKPLLSDKKDR